MGLLLLLLLLYGLQLLLMRTHSPRGSNYIGGYNERVCCPLSLCLCPAVTVSSSYATECAQNKRERKPKHSPSVLVFAPISCSSPYSPDCHRSFCQAGNLFHAQGGAGCLRPVLHMQPRFFQQQH